MIRVATSTISLPVLIPDDEQQSIHRTEAAHTAEESVEPRPVHPDSHRMFKACGGAFGWIRYVPIFGEAVECYGPKFVFSLDFTEFMSKGLAYNILQNASQPMFVNYYKCTAMQFQRFNNVSTMGWSIKPFTALIADSFPLFHYTKRWYMVLSCILGAASCVVFGCLPGNNGNSSTAAAFAFLAGYGQANLDILSEGMYSRLMRRYPAAGPALVSSLWWILSVAGIIAAFIQGPLSDGGKEQIGTYIAGGCMIVALPFFVFNWFGEKTNREERLADRAANRIDEEKNRARERNEPTLETPVKTLDLPQECDGTVDGQDDVIGFSNAHPNADASSVEDDDDLHIPSCMCGMIEFNRDVLLTNYRLTLYSIVMTVGVIATVIATINGSTWPLFGVCLGVSLTVGIMSFWALPPVVARASLFAFLNQMLYVQITGPLQTFYVATEEEYPPGPHFSYFFYNATSSAIGNIAAVIAVSMFPYVFAKRTYRLTFIITAIMMVAGSIFDLIMVKRWNVDVGIPDHLTYIWGDAVVYQVAYMLNWMPMIVLLAQLCPRGAESTVYALLAGFSNLGQTMAAEIGTLLMDFAWSVDTNDIPFDFSNLPWLIIVGHLIVPLFQIPLVFILIPGARICDRIDADGKIVVEEEGLEQDIKKLVMGTSSNDGQPTEEEAVADGRAPHEVLSQ